ncbi:hypothetical protein SESBI_27960 [Sesbania bispinosa]|nr:hypothetical protein SESBI_27960 [Sesbania bispinosa]
MSQTPQTLQSKKHHLKLCRSTTRINPNLVAQKHRPKLSDIAKSQVVPSASPCAFVQRRKPCHWDTPPIPGARPPCRSKREWFRSNLLASITEAL